MGYMKVQVQVQVQFKLVYFCYPETYTFFRPEKPEKRNILLYNLFRFPIVIVF